MVVQGRDCFILELTGFGGEERQPRKTLAIGESPAPIGDEGSFGVRDFEPRLIANHLARWYDAVWPHGRVRHDGAGGDPRTSTDHCRTEDRRVFLDLDVWMNHDRTDQSSA